MNEEWRFVFMKDWAAIQLLKKTTTKIKRVQKKIIELSWANDKKVKVECRFGLEHTWGLDVICMCVSVWVCAGM